MRIPIRPLVEPVLGGALGELGNSAVTGALIGRKIEVRETVAIEVAYCHAPSVIVVEVVEDVEGRGFSQRVRERHTGTLRRETREQRWRRRIIAAGRAAKEKRAKKDEKSRPIH